MKKSAAKKVKQKTNYVLFFALAAAGLLIGSVLVQPITSVLKAEEGVSYSEGKSVLTWDKIKGATAYVIYYKEVTDPTFTYAINVPANRTSYTIENLKAGTKYEYKISAVDADNKEFLWTPVAPLP